MKAWMAAGVSSSVGGLAVAAALMAMGACHPTSVAATSYESACGDLYTSLIGRCDLPGYPQSEVTREQGRWSTYCQSLPELPGWTASSVDVEACARAVATLGCSNLNLPVTCNPILLGSLEAGAPCLTGSQCSSGECGQSVIDGGETVCGTCDTLVTPGGSCGSVGESCGTSAYCAFAEDGGRTCVAQPNDADAGDAGAVDAAPTLAVAGQPCDVQGALVCGPGLACAENHVCAALELASAGQPCDDYAEGCLVGECANASQTTLPDGGIMNVAGTCPTVVMDGQPCEANSQTAVCDAYAMCVNGTCVLAVSATTCM